jgi:hypothetical protein
MTGPGLQLQEQALIPVQIRRKKKKKKRTHASDRYEKSRAQKIQVKWEYLYCCQFNVDFGIFAFWMRP